MLLPCPFCGPRDVAEFAYRGDATVTRPSGDDADAMYAYVYERENPAGPHTEHWVHASGCRAWVVVERDTRTHEILSARLVRELAP